MRALVVLLVLGLSLGLGPIAALPASDPTIPACPGARPPVLFAQWDTQLENLVFDGEGNLFVSDLGGDRLLHATPDGAMAPVLAVPGMHGLTRGPDGMLYYGGTGPDGAPAVWRASPLETDGFELVASGLVSANGMAFDADGDLFVSNPGLGSGAPYLVRLPADNMAAWSDWSADYGVNGVWRVDDRLLAAVTADQSSPILSISTSDPTDVRVVAQLTLGAITLQPGAHAPAGGPGLAPKGLDDITYHEGWIYAAAHVTGEVVRVDPDTGSACVLASGLEEPTSVRVAHGFGAWDGMIEGAPQSALEKTWTEGHVALFVTDMGGAGVTALFGPGAGAIWAIDIGA